MKKTKTYLLGMTLMLGMAGCTKKDATVAPAAQEGENSVELAGKGGGPSANGQGTLTVGGETRHFSFHANTAGNGNVQGSGVITFTANGGQVKFDINCLNVSGNVAIMSGTITQNRNAPVNASVGTPCWVRVVDNGEGSNDPADQTTLLYFGNTLLSCATNLNVPQFLVEGGNVQVKL